MSNSIQKYARRNVPRYTSYPTAPHFTDAVGAADYVAALEGLDPAKPVSLYLHVPFCNTRTEFIQNLNRWGIDITIHKHNPAGMHTHTHAHSRTNLHLLIYWCRLLQYHRILRTSPNIDSHQTAGRANSTIPAFVTVYLCGLSEFLNQKQISALIVNELAITRWNHRQ